MGLVHTDSFNLYASTADLTNNYTNAGNWTWSASAGRNGDGAIVGGTGGQTGLLSRPAIWPANTVQLGVGLWFKCAAHVSAAKNYLQLLNAAGTSQGTLGLSTSGFVTIGDVNGVVRATGTTDVCDGAFHWLEFYWDIRNTQTLKAYADTVQQFSGTFSASTAGTSAEKYQWLSNNSQQITISYPIFFDANAPSPQISAIPLGPRQVTYQLMSNDSSVQFVPNTGSTNFTQIDEISADGDTSYVQSATSGQVDLYGIAGLSFTPATINAIQVVARVKNPGPGTINHKVRCSSNAVTSDTASTVTPSSYQNTQLYVNQDPNTSAAWTPGNLTNAKFGVTVV